MQMRGFFASLRMTMVWIAREEGRGNDEDNGDQAVSGWVEMTVFSMGEESGRAWREYPLLRYETAKEGAPGWIARLAPAG
jgi:hypothetical protein